MKSLWENTYDRTKDRRYGRLFLAVWSGVIVFLLIFRAGEEFLSEYPSRSGQITAAVLLVLLLAPGFYAGVEFIVNRRRRRGERGNCSPLSSDELTKARSKLQNSIRVVRPVVTRAPDTDLKF